MSGTASIYSLAAEDHARAEQVAWARFSVAKDHTEFFGSWLAILCTQIHRVQGGLLLLGPDRDGAYAPAAVWPDRASDLQYLTPAAEKALRERRGIVVGRDGAAAPARDDPALIGYPVEVSGVLHGVVALHIAAGSEQSLQSALRLLHWATAWLLDHFRQRLLQEHDARAGRLTLAMEIAATALQESRLAASSLATANELASRLGCERVSIGFEKSGRVEVNAISHNASFDPKMALVRLIGDAMDEVLDLEAPVLHPPPEDEPVGAMAHAELAREFKSVAICSVPLHQDGEVIGVVTLERVAGEPFDPPTLELCQTIGALLGPILALKRDNERGLPHRLGQAILQPARVVFGAGHPGAKLLAVVAIIAGATLGFVTDTYRVSAKTAIEGAVQRAAVAPFEGHIAESAVRAGAAVRQGQLLARLDDRDLRLEHRRLESERMQLLLKQRQALASQDRPTMVVLAAQISQVEAQIALIADKLARASLTAPFDGVIVSGDLSQLLGAPVEQGKVLFQIAPLNAYRVILQVDERDIAEVAAGQTGDLVLSGMPHATMPFVVELITPASTAQEGRNFFRVEAHLQQPNPGVRPGMEGVGKIGIGERRLIWIWTHSLVDWLRAWAWKELP